MPRKKIKQENKAEKQDNIQETRQLKLVLILMVVVILAFLASYFAGKWIINEMRTFEYKGVKFEKAEISYIANFPIEDIYGKTIDVFRIMFWQDPRNLERISSDNIRLKTNTFLAVDSKFVESCEDSIQAGTTLAIFLTKFNINVAAASANKTEAELMNKDYADCSNTSRGSVIISRKGEESKIIKQGDCYILQAANNCEIMNVTERFMLGLYVNSKGQAL